MIKITHDQLLETVNYNSESGHVNWRHGHATNGGTRAGYARADGYRQLGINGTSYLEHTLVWFYVYGQWPADTLDHINRINSDNRISNLRQATRAQNGANRGPMKRNASGFKGVVYLARIRKYRATITVSGKRTTLGYYPTPEEAASAYQEAARVHYGEYAYSRPTGK